MSAEAPPAPSGFTRRLTGWPVAVALAALYVALGLAASWHWSPTSDEPTYLMGGYSHWRTGDYRLHPENGALPQRFAALPLYLSDQHFPDLEQPAWRASNQYALALEMFFRLDNDPQTLVRMGRAMILLLGAALGLLIYGWARHLFGAGGGLLALGFFVFDPTMLTQGAQVSADVPMALFLTLATTCLWWLLQKVTPVRVLCGALALTALALTKVSGVLILPILFIMLAVRLWDGRALPVSLFGKTWHVTARVKMAAVWVAALAVQLVLIVMLIWGAYGFRYSAFKPGSDVHAQLQKPWEEVLERGGAVNRFVGVCRDHQLLPEAYLYGYSYIWLFMHRRAFLNGAYSVTGWRTFFPYAFAVKTPPPFLLALGVALVAGAWKWKRAREASADPPADTDHPKEVSPVRRVLYAAAPLLALGAVYWWAVIRSTLNIGQRHLVPGYVPLFITAGALVWLLARSAAPRRWATPLIAALLMCQIGVAAWSYPHYMAYFNELAGGPDQGYRHLVDGSLDLGQDLPALKTYLDNRDDEAKPPLYVGYFGPAHPSHYGIDGTLIARFPDDRSDKSIRPLSGGTYAISATLLQSIGLRDIFGKWSQANESDYQKARAHVETYRATKGNPGARGTLLVRHGQYFWRQTFDLYDQLRFARLTKYLLQREPDAYAGYSILIYQLSDEDLRAALDGPPVELHPTREVKGADF